MNMLLSIVISAGFIYCPLIFSCNELEDFLAALIEHQSLRLLFQRYHSLLRPLWQLSSVENVPAGVRDRK